MSRKLTNEDYCRAAKRLNCSVAAIKTVAQVESAQSGFLPSGKVIILFERHHFSRLTNRIYDATHPQISSRNPGGYYGNEKEYQRFNAAFALNPTAAMMSCSWGKFQIMGFNYGVCGFSSVNAFVDAMKESEGGQLQAFCGFVETNNLDDELKRLDWAGFARGYNGKNYKINRYDEKMAQFYARFKKENINCAEITPDNIGAKIDSISAASLQSSAPTVSGVSNNPPVTATQPPPIQPSGAVASGDSFAQTVADTNPAQTQPAPETLPDEPQGTTTVTETITEKRETPTGETEKKTETSVDIFNPKNIPAFIPRFGKQWLLGLIPGGGLLTTIIAKLAALPDWLVFLLGVFTGITLVLFAQLIIKHREKVLDFIIQAYKTTADPTQHNLIPTPAKDFLGHRRGEILNAFAQTQEV